jgi:diacylglycerol O-acyltransferase
LPGCSVLCCAELADSISGRQLIHEHQTGKVAAGATAAQTQDWRRTAGPDPVAPRLQSPKLSVMSASTAIDDATTAGTVARPERLSRADSARWHMSTPENPMVIGALLHFDQRLALEALEELVRSKLLAHRRFRQHVVEAAHRVGRPIWEEDSAFDPRAHVRKLDSPHPADAAALVGFVNEAMTAPLARDRSPWTFDLVDLASGGSALLVRIHHCMADGQALVALLGELADEATPAAESTSRRQPSPSRLDRRRLLEQLTGLYRFLTLSDDPESPLRRSPSGEKRVAWSDAIPLDAIKAIARARGHHLTDVLLAGVAGALDRYERDHRQTPRSIRALLPVALPPSSSGDAAGNHYASVFVRLPIAVSDPQARLAAIARDMTFLRAWGGSRTAIGLTKLAGSVAPGIERRAMRRWSRRASLVVSSLSGPMGPLRLAGHPIRSIVVWAPSPANIGLSVTFFGYAGALRLGALADVAVLDRPEELVAAFQPAIDELARGAPPSSG